MGAFSITRPGLRHFDEDFEWEMIMPAGALITEIMPDSPAAKAGLQEDDVIISVDEKEIEPETDLAELIHAYDPGDQIILGVLRQGKGEPSDVLVTLQDNPDKAGQTYLGITYTYHFPIHLHIEDKDMLFHIPPFHKYDWLEREYDEEGKPSLRFRFDGLPFWYDFQRLPEAGDHVVILDVMLDSPAEQAGLQEGDLITAIDDQPVDHAESLVDIIHGHKPGDKISISLLRIDEDQRLNIQITLGVKMNEPGKAYLGVKIGVISVTKWDNDSIQLLIPNIPQEWLDPEPKETT
jgi:C-terminal processing protease CtpA/Prc